VNTGNNLCSDIDINTHAYVGGVSQGGRWQEGKHSLSGATSEFEGSEFEDSGKRTVVFEYVKAHAGIEGNERADKLAGKGAKLRHDIMVRSQPKGWFRHTVEQYWSRRV